MYFKQRYFNADYFQTLFTRALNDFFGYDVIYVTDSIKPIYAISQSKSIYLFKIHDQLFAYTVNEDLSNLVLAEKQIANIDFDELYVIKSVTDIRCLITKNDIIVEDFDKVIYVYTKYLESLITTTQIQSTVFDLDSAISTLNLQTSINVK